MSQQYNRHEPEAWFNTHVWVVFSTPQMRWKIYGKLIEYGEFLAVSHPQGNSDVTFKAGQIESIVQDWPGSSPTITLK